MSDANYSTLAAKRETTWGASITPPLKAMRLTGESLEHKKDVVQSEEVRADRQISDLAEVGSMAGGGVDFELSYEAWKEWLEAALFSSIVTINAAGITCDIDSTGQTIEAASGTPFANVVAGCFVKVAGAANAGNNGAKLVLSKTNTVLTLAAGSLTDDETAVSLTITGGHLKNGTTRHSYTIERNILTQTGDRFFQVYRGMTVDKCNLNFESKKIVTGKLEFIGKIGEANDTSLQTAAAGTLTFSGVSVEDETVTIGTRVYTFKDSPASANQVKTGADAAESIANLVAAINGAAGAGTLYGTGTVAHAQGTAAAVGSTLVFTSTLYGTAGNALATTETMTNASWGAATLAGGTDYTAADSDPVVNATSNLGSLRKDGISLGERFKKLELAISNNLRGKDAIGEAGNFDIGVGSFEVTGTLSAYFKDNTLLADFIAHNYTGLSYVVTDGNGKRIGVHIPRLNFSTGGPMIGGKNTDLMQDQKFTAILSETYGATLLLSFLD